MNLRIFLLAHLLLQVIVASAMQSPQQNDGIVYRVACQEDTLQLLQLINTQAIHDRDKIVILPKKFRLMALEAGIKKNRYFIAENAGHIVGYKKLFLMTDEEEKKDVLAHEIRCINNECNCTFNGLIDKNGVFHENGSAQPNNDYDLCIYNGGDFTLPTYRGKGINQQLTNYALMSLIGQVRQQMQKTKASAITMLFGLTQANAGQYPGSFSDRTSTIVKSFKIFLNEIENRQNESPLIYHRYRAFMPTFDPESQECKPLADEYSIPGFGCVLTYQLGGLHE